MHCRHGYCVIYLEQRCLTSHKCLITLITKGGNSTATLALLVAEAVPKSLSKWPCGSGGIMTDI